MKIRRRAYRKLFRWAKPMYNDKSGAILYLRHAMQKSSYWDSNSDTSEWMHHIQTKKPHNLVCPRLSHRFPFSLRGCISSRSYHSLTALNSNVCASVEIFSKNYQKKEEKLPQSLNKSLDFLTARPRTAHHPEGKRKEHRRTIKLSIWISSTLSVFSGVVNTNPNVLGCVCDTFLFAQ